MKLLVTFLSSIFFISGCMTQKKESMVDSQNFALLKDQQTLLENHSTRLDALSLAQETLLNQLAEIQTNIRSLASQIRSNGEAPKEVIVKKPVESKKTAQAVQGKAVIGRVEYVWIPSATEYLKARIDTGAKSSSLNAKNIQPFERNGDRWVRFDIQLEEKTRTIEAPLQRYVRIRQASVDQLERRPVVKLALQMGEIVEETEFTLSNREEMIYPVLLGRSFLQDIAIVDVAKKFTRPRDPKLNAQVAAQ